MYNNIFIIDDSDIDVYIIKRLLKIRDFPEHAYISFSYAREALGHIEDAIHKGNITKLPDLIFLDINMADMSGLEFLEKLQQLPGDFKHTVHIIVLSSSDDAEDISKSTSYKQVKRFLRKPLDNLSVLD